MKHWMCKLLGHKIAFAPFLPHSHQNWYDTICTRCGRAQTIMAGINDGGTYSIGMPATAHDSYEVEVN